MNKILKYTKLLLVCSLIVAGLSSCDTDDDDIIYDYLVDETWIGDLGFADRYGDALQSGLYFKRNGSGIDDQVYFDDLNEKVAFSLPFYWELYNGVLTLDYGLDYPLFEIYDVRVTRNKLSGTLYVDGINDGYIVMERY